MARLAVIAAALATLLPFPSTADADGGSALALYHVGDSLAAGTSRYLKGFLTGWTVRQDVAIGMRSSEVADLVRSGRSTLPRVIVVSAGTNGTPTAIARLTADVNAVVKVAGPGRCVIWATIARPPYRGVSYAGLNRELRRLDGVHANLALLDWAAMVKLHPWWVSRDGIHGSAEAYRARARATAALAKACAS